LYAYCKNDFLNFTYFLETYKLGLFGDFIGGFLGSILTGIATFLVYRTYVYQKQELEVQSKLIAKQQFENTFFNMLNVHRELNLDEQFLLFYNFIHFNEKENGIYSTIKLVNHYTFFRKHRN
jgi:hypothetical protein